jgi:hypothetical protein
MLQAGKSIYLNLAAALGPGVYSASNRNEYQTFLEVERKVDNLTAICEPTI